MLSRESIRAAVRAAVEPLPFVHAMWEGGSAAFGRADMKHDPARYDFGPEYLYNDLPEDEARRVRDLYFVADGADLRRKHAQASAWVRELMKELDDA